MPKQPYSKPRSVFTQWVCRFTVSLILSALPLSLYAREFQCEFGEDKRFVRVDYPGINHLCEVSVTKSDNTRQVKWYADLDSTFCSRKIVELVGKYENQWGFSCEEWPDINKIDNLSSRHRKLLDDIVKQTMATALAGTPRYSVLGARALVTPNLPLAAAKPIEPTQNQKSKPQSDREANTLSLLAVQLFLTSSDPGLLSPTSQILLVEDNGVNHRTLATLAELKQHIKVEKAGYQLDSAMIESLSPSGEIQVATLVTAPGDEPENAPSCYGQQRFITSDGEIKSVDQHRFICDL